MFSPSLRCRCDTRYDVVKEETYKVECKIKLESVCPEPHNTYTAGHYRPVRDLGHGCYPVPRRSCVKVPVVEARKVPTSSCLPVPDVLCYNVLTPVQDVYCEPVVSRDCRNVSVEVPYIKTESQCDEIVYDECQEVGVKQIYLTILSVSVTGGEKSPSGDLQETKV